jgi:outer membrane protein, heavy metal efflux system
MKAVGAMARVGLVGLGAVLVPGSLLAQGGAAPAAEEAWTEEAIVAAVQTSFALQASRASAAADAERPGQVRWPFPMVEVMPMPGTILDGEMGAQVMARQTIPWPGRLAADRTARLRMAAAGAHEADALALDLVTAARMTFAELWGQQEQVARIQEYITQLELYREAALAQYATGRGPQQAVLGIQVEAEILAQRLEALLEDRAGLLARIEALTGGNVRIGPADRLAPPAARPGHPPGEGNATGAAVAPYRSELDDHPVLEAGRAMVEAEKAMAAMSRTMLRPEFTVGVNLNLSRMAFDRMYGQEPVMPAIGVMLPLWRGGVRAQVREAELRARQRELETADARVRLEAELGDVLTQLERVQARIARYEGQLRPQVRQTLDASLAGYQAGMTRFLELLDAQRMALDVEVDLIMARVREAALVARLDAVTGRSLEDT